MLLCWDSAGGDPPACPVNPTPMSLLLAEVGTLDSSTFEAPQLPLNPKCTELMCWPP